MLGILVVELLASRAGATPAVCRDAVIAASARYTQSATKALGRGADEYVADGAVADVSHLRALAEGVRAEVLARFKRS